jgi:hypothetical protein
MTISFQASVADQPASASQQVDQMNSSIRLPASVLQMHPVVKVLVDESAASKLKRQDYYRHVFEQKPKWQRW